MQVNEREITQHKDPECPGTKGIALIKVFHDHLQVLKSKTQSASVK